MAERDHWYSIQHGEGGTLWSRGHLPPWQNGGITPEDGNGDPEYPRAQQRMHLQHIIFGHVDEGLRATLLHDHEEGSWDPLTRLRELITHCFGS